MTIKVKKQVDEEIQLELPAYFKSSYNTFHQITERGLVTVYKDAIYTDAADYVLFPDHVNAAMKEQPSNEQEFKEAFQKTSDRLNDLAGFSIVPSLQLQD